MTKALDFQHRDGVHVAFVQRRITTTWGSARYAFGAVRVIRESAGAFRIDRCDAVGGAWLPWEPIDSEAYPSSRKAKSALRRWARDNAVFGAAS